MPFSRAYCDEITLKNGQILEGNVIRVIEEEKALILDIVIDGELINGRIQLNADDMDIIEINEDFKHLKQKELSKEEIKANNDMYYERQRRAWDINDRIFARIDQRRKIKLAQENRDKNRLHEKEVVNIRHRNRKDLITYSKNELVTPVVEIEDRDASQNYHHHYYGETEDYFDR